MHVWFHHENMQMHDAMTTVRQTSVAATVEYSKQTLALRQTSEESACFLLSFFCDD